MKKMLAATVVFMAAISVFAAEISGEYTLLVGESLRIDAQGLNRVSMYTPGILSIVKTTSTAIEVLGQSEGETILELGSSVGKQTYRVRVNSRDIDEALIKVKDMVNRQMGLSDVYVTKNKLTNRLLMEGEASEEDIQKMTTVLGQYMSIVDNFVKKAESEDIVDIAVKIVEVNRDEGKTLGIAWPSNFSYGETSGGRTRTVDPFTSLDRVKEGFDPLFGFMENQSRSSLSATLNFLVTEGKAEILSEPTVSCLSGKEASLAVGGSTPILSTAGQGADASTSVQYMTYGINLSVSPKVRPEDEMVEINLNVSITDLDSQLTLGSSGSTTASASSTTSRSTATVMLMRNGQTMSVSGLIKKTESESASKLPWLSDVPVLGKFFKNKQNGKKNTELVILLTPIIRKTPKKTKRMNEIAQEEKDYGDRAVVFSSNPSERHDAGVSEYAADIRKQILGVLTYPSEARRAGWEADVTITIHVAEDGYILSVEKKKSSQHEMFDEHLINTVKAMKYLSPFPGTVREKELWLDVPFSFTMSE